MKFALAAVALGTLAAGPAIAGCNGTTCTLESHTLENRFVSRGSTLASPRLEVANRWFAVITACDMTVAPKVCKTLRIGVRDGKVYSEGDLPPDAALEAATR